VNAKAELVRLALVRHRPGDPSAVVIDERQRLQGRGAYLCKGAEQSGKGAERSRKGAEQTLSASCLQLALRRGGIARTLRCGPKIDSSDLLKSVGQ
jgi:predicted RNA-binding protein YlxR (DUF448 family)